MKFDANAKVIVASILALGAVTGEKSESVVMEIFKRMFSELEKIEKEPGSFNQSFE